MKFLIRFLAVKWMFWLPVLLGAAALHFSFERDTALERVPVAELSRTFRVIQIPKTEFVPRALGYGTARPQKVWRAVAEVQGKLAYVHPDVSSGAIVREGARLLEVEKTEYELEHQRLLAELKKSRNELAALDLREANLKTMIEIETRSLEFARNEVERLRRLAESNAATRSQLDTAQRTLLEQLRALQSQRYELDLMPTQRRTLQATIDSQEARVKDAEIDLRRTEIIVPFDSRLRDFDLQEGQFVTIGEVLFEADGLDATEVVAEVSVEKAATLIDPTQMSLGQIMEVLASRDTTSIRDLFRLDATIRVSAGDLEASWEARFINASSDVDPKTRTIGFVTVVDRPYEKTIPGERPPLVRGVFCEVELRGTPRANRIVVPRDAIYGDHVYLVNDQSRLERRRVVVELIQSGVAVIRSGLEGGETLVVSDPTPAIDGQLVETVTDEELLQALIAQANGKERLR